MLIAITVLLLLLALNGVFAMAELAVMTSRRSRLQQAAKKGSGGAAAALSLAQDPTRFLSTVQVGITLIGILSGAFGERALSTEVAGMLADAGVRAEYADEIALVLVVLVITYCSLVIGELVPKRIALAYPEAVASLIARPLTILSRIAAWPVKLLTVSTEVLLRIAGIKPPAVDDVSEEDVRSLIARAASTGIFTPQERKLFERTMRAGDLMVRDIMVSRPGIVWIDESEPMDAVRVLVGSSPYSHFPICRGGLDHVTGVVHVKDLIAYGLIAGSDFKITDVASKPLFVPESMPALRLLDQFQSTRVHVAFVVDEFGVIQGLLTLNDITRAIVGDISRQGDTTTPTLTRRDDGSWIVDGRLPLHELVVGLQIPAEIETQLPDVQTVAGLTMSVLGHIPVEGETLTWEGWEFEVIDMDGTRIDKLLVKRLKGAPHAAKTPEGNA